MPLGPDVDLRKLAEITHGFTGADLAALAREAAMSALRRAIQSGLIDLNQPSIPPEVFEKIKVTMADFMMSQ